MTLFGPAVLTAALALGALLGAELWPAAPPVEAAAAPPPPQAAGSPATPPVAAWANIALARPLFAPDRRAAAAAAGTPAALPRLAGTIRSDDGLIAIFAPAGDGHPLVTGRGGEVAGWLVADIKDGQVTLTRGAAATELRLSYANLPPAPLPTGPKAAVLLHERHSSPFLQP